MSRPVSRQTAQSGSRPGTQGGTGTRPGTSGTAVTTELDDELNEFDDSVEGLEGRLGVLNNRRDEILRTLHAVEHALETKGSDVSKQECVIGEAHLQHALQNKFVAKQTPKSAITINGKLTFRAREKADELFDLLDTNDDGYLEFEDFRAMKSIVSPFGVVHDAQYLNIESWKLYLYDIGIMTIAGKVNKKDFFKYRLHVEHQRPLEKELLLVKLGTLPHLQQRWIHLKGIIDEVMHLREDTGINENLGDLLDVEDMIYILSNVDVIAPRYDILTLLHRRAIHGRNMDELLRNALTRQIGHDADHFAPLLESGHMPEKFVEMNLSAIKYVSRAALAAWYFAGRTAVPCPRITRCLLYAKYRIYRFKRRIDDATKILYDAGSHLRLRKVFGDFQPSEKFKEKNSKVFLQAGLQIGVQDSSVEEGLGVTWGMTKITQPEEFCVRMKVPKDSGLAYFFDLAVKEDALEEEVKKAADALVLYLKAHFEAEFRSNVQYRGIFVQPADNDMDNSRVIRIAVAFRRVASFDAWFTYMLLPDKLHEIVTDISGEFKTSTSLPDLLISTSNVDEIFAARSFFRFTFMRDQVMNVLKRLELILHSGPSEDEVTPSADKDKEREIALWRKLQEYIPSVHSWLNFVKEKVVGLKSAATMFKYRSLSESLEMVGWDNSYLRRLLPKDVALQPKYMQKIIMKWIEDFGNEADAMFTKVKAYTDSKMAEEEKARMKVLMMTKEERANATKEESEKEARATMLNRLKRVGVNLKEKDLEDDNSGSPEGYMAKQLKEQVERETQGLVVYERLHKVCTGLHSMQLLCGHSLLTANIQGMDVFEYLPPPPPMIEQRARWDLEQRKADERVRKYMVQLLGHS